MAEALTTAKETSSNFRIRLTFWVLGAVLGCAQAWTSRFDAIDNTVSYLEMGIYFFHGHHSAVINGFWSPLYALLLGLTMTVFKPSMYWEYPMVHLVVLIIFLLTMLCFDYFLRHLMRLRSDLDPGKKGSASLDWVWISIGYSLFFWSSMQLIGVNNVTPDMLVAGLFYLSCGLLLTISAGRAKWGTFLGLGVTLGLSYLTKLAVLPISFIILVTAWFVAKQKSRYLVISAIAFLTIAAPFIAALSAQRGRFTYGDSTRYDYAVNVNHIPHYHWQGDSTMPLKHPTRQIFANPDTYEFREPLMGTYPPEYDLTYWYEGIKPQIHIGQEIKVLAANLFYEFETWFFSMNGILLTAPFLVFYSTGRGWQILKDLLRYWFLVLPSVGTGVLYAIAYYNPQYLAAPFVVLSMCLLLSAAYIIAPPMLRLLSGVAVLQLLLFFGLVGLPALLHVINIHPRHRREAERASYQQVAAKLVEMGLRPGDPIASLNASNGGNAMWAHLARVQIIAEVYYWPGEEVAADNFWNAGPLTQERVIQKLSQTGARAVISQETPRGTWAGRWEEIGKTGYYLYWLKHAE